MSLPPGADQARLPLRRRMTKRLVAMAASLAPLLYRGWMRLVEATGSFENVGNDALWQRSEAEGRGVVVLVLHQDLLLLPWLYRDHEVCTVASTGDAGEFITRTLESVGFTVLRGGSSSRQSRRETVFHDVVRYARTRGHKGFTIAVTADGSRGPAGACKPGYVWLAMRTRAEIWCVKSVASRALYLDTWDRTAIPLPGARLRVEAAGPFLLPERPTREQLNEIHQRTEAALHDLHARAFAAVDRAPVPATLSPWQPTEAARYRSLTGRRPR